MKPKLDKEPSMTPTRLRELIRSAEDSAADTSQTYAQIETARDTAAALRELVRLRDDAQGAPELLEALRKVAQALEWHAHGRCRGLDDGGPMSSSDAVALAEAAISRAIGA